MLLLSALCFQCVVARAEPTLQRHNTWGTAKVQPAIGVQEGFPILDIASKSFTVPFRTLGRAGL